MRSARSAAVVAGWRVAAALVVCLLAAVSAPVFGQTDDEKLQSFLGRLGLTDLQTAHLEEQLSSLPAGERRTQLARQLADLYAQQLTENVSDRERYAQLSERVQKLLELAPEAKTAALEVMLLQVDYQRAESLIRDWLSQPDQQAAHDEAQAILQRITPLLAAHYEQLWKRVDEQLAVVETAEANAEPAERELTRRQAIAARAAYFAGWSLYYRGILATPIQRDDCQSAQAIFRRLLDISAHDKYADLDAETLALESPWRARALVGLGMCEAAVGNTTLAIDCFRILSEDVTAAEVRDQADYWCAQSLLLSGSRQAALEYARQQITSMPAEATEGRIGFCAALISGGARDPATRNNPESQQLTNLGIRGLARLRQFRVLHELIRSYGIPVDNPEGFLLLWLQGQQRLSTAQDSKRAQDFAAAAESFRQALSASDALSDVAAAAHCREQLAWCYYNQEKFAEAASEYQRAAEAMKAVNDDGAVEAAWMSFVAANRAAEKGGPDAPMQAAAKWLNEHFPAHEQARRATFMLAKAKLRNASPADRLRALRDIPPDDPNYSSARQEICAALYQQWREADPDDKNGLAEQLNAVLADTLTPDSLSRIPPAEQLLLRLMATDVALNASPPDQSEAAKHISAASGLVARSGVPPEAVAEYHYRALLLAKVANDYLDIVDHAEWFLEQGAGTRFESPALIMAAKAVDAVTASAADEAAAGNELGYRIYGRLQQLLAADRENVSTNRNSQVALSRLAHYAYRIGKREEAAAALDQLLAAFPKDRGYLRRAGLIRFELHQFDVALGHWRTILAGSRAGTEPWYEAKYYQIACLLEVDRDAAASVFEQLRLLDPELGSPEWRPKFAELQQRL